MVKNLGMILKDEIKVANVGWQGNLPDEQGLSKCAESRKGQRQRKTKSDEGKNRLVCISSSKGTDVSLLSLNTTLVRSTY